MFIIVDTVRFYICLYMFMIYSTSCCLVTTYGSMECMYVFHLILDHVINEGNIGGNIINKIGIDKWLCSQHCNNLQKHASI
jgi:hypothetical protein